MSPSILFIGRSNGILLFWLTQAFIIHFNDIHVSIYWAKFRRSYLAAVQAGLADLRESVELYHTKRYSLLDMEERTEFFRHFIAVFRFISEGRANVGFLRRDVEDNPINRVDGDKNRTEGQENGDTEDDEEAEKETSGPPQQVLDLDEFDTWIEEESWRYRT
jgi:hypothetical protein